MKPSFIFLISFFAPGLGQISMGRKTLGFSFLSLILIITFAIEQISMSKITYLTLNGLAWFMFLLPTCILAWDYFKNKKILLSNEVKLGSLCLVFLIYVIIATLISKFPFNRVYVNPAASMSPLIKAGDYVSYKNYYFNKKLPERGTVIIFEAPNEKILYTKRLIGLPGDEIKIIDDKITLNGSEISQKKIAFDFKDKRHLYLSPMSLKENPLFFEESLGNLSYKVMILEGLSSMNQESYKVPEGHVYVLGDNRSNSKDSRHIKAIPIENVKGEFRFVLD